MRARSRALDIPIKFDEFMLKYFQINWSKLANSNEIIKKICAKHVPDWNFIENNFWHFFLFFLYFKYKLNCWDLIVYRYTQSHTNNASILSPKKYLFSSTNTLDDLIRLSRGLCVCMWLENLFSKQTINDFIFIIVNLMKCGHHIVSVLFVW